MIQARYDQKYNAIIIEFSGKINVAEVERSQEALRPLVLQRSKGFKLLTDFSGVEEMDLGVRETIKKNMDLFNAQGVKEILRVIPDPAQDIGFNIMSLFHYSKDVKFLIFKTREEAEAHLS